MLNLQKSHSNGYFEGWYFKQQNEKETVALIPAFHTDRDGNRSASLQVITNEDTFNIDFPDQTCEGKRMQLPARLGKCLFSEQGIGILKHRNALCLGCCGLAR